MVARMAQCPRSARVGVVLMLPAATNTHQARTRRTHGAGCTVWRVGYAAVPRCARTRASSGSRYRQQQREAKKRSGSCDEVKQVRTAHVREQGAKKPEISMLALRRAPAKCRGRYTRVKKGHAQ